MNRAPQERSRAARAVTAVLVLTSILAGLFGTPRIAAAQSSALTAQMARLGLAAPRLGVQGRFEPGFGLVVQYVQPRSPASRTGMEPGDVIRAVNGRWLRTEFEFRRQLRNSDGRLRLVIEDVRTGRLLTRDVIISRSGRGPF